MHLQVEFSSQYMIVFEKKQLANGLTVIAHTDRNSCMAAVNLLYKVGARNEKQDRTGMAHLFEHLMFSGSENVEDFDAPLQVAGGENNAFTNNDYTNYYIAIPAENIETALWVESDRMQGLMLDEQSLDVQRKVVCEEFAQRYLNEPYGDLWSLLRPMCYGEGHPYSWPTIGQSVEQIQSIEMDDVRSFYGRFYAPSNAILSIVAPMSHDEIFSLAEQWFADVKSDSNVVGSIDWPERPSGGYLKVERDVAASMVYICFPIEGRTSRQVTVLDVASDILSEGASSRLVQRLVKERGLFSSVNAYISGDEGPGLFVVTARLMPSCSIDEAQVALWDELREVARGEISDYEIEKVRNKAKANEYFSNINILNKAMNLAYYEFLGSAEMINHQLEEHHSVEREEIASVCSDLFDPSKAYVFHYIASPVATKVEL